MHIPGVTLLYLGLAFGLLVVPRALQRYRIPAQLTCFAFGIVAAIYVTRLAGDEVSRVVATFGIAALFLLAGMEVDFVEIRRHGSDSALTSRCEFCFLRGWRGRRRGLRT